MPSLKFISVGTKVKEAQSEMMITQMRRQLIMQNEMRERGISMQLAMARRQFQYWTVFVTPLALILPIAAIKTKKPQLIAPLWPLGIVTTFQYDMAHGSGVIEARKEAELIMKHQRELLEVPNGMPSVDDIVNKK